MGNTPSTGDETYIEGYPTKLVEAFGGIENIHKLPILDLGQQVGSTDYIDFVMDKDMNKGIMKGTDVYGRPFIAFRYVNNKKPQHGLQVQTLFRRYTDSNRTWCFGSHGSRDNSICAGHVANAEIYEKIGRLVANQPVGEYTEEATESTEKIMPDGRSVIELA